MVTPKTIVFLRADGDGKIGLGHIHRLLALSEILKKNFYCKFLIRSPLPGIRELILKSCSEIIEINAQAKQSEEINQIVTGKEIIVLDGYRFDTTYQQTIRQRGVGLICVDDIHQYHFVADIIINPAGGVDEEMYSKEKTTKLFTGPGFSFLKKPFLEAARNGGKKISNNSIFICMGGADPDNNTLKVLQRCLDFSFYVYNVVVGEAYAHKSDLEKEAQRLGRNIKILINLTPEALADCMSQSEVAVCSASGIAYEYLCTGGELYVKKTASNQTHIFDYLLKEELAFDFIDFRTKADVVTQALQRQRKIFDGNSDTRILKIFHRLDFDLNFSIRRMGATDVQITFQWANDSELRSQSFNSDPILFENHETWFNRKINDSSAFLYIFEYKNLPIAQVRFDVGEEATISYSIDRHFRGRGWGHIVVEKAIERFQHEREIGKPNKIVGYVKLENLSSNIIFEKLGFAKQNSQEHPGSYKYELI